MSEPPKAEIPETLRLNGCCPSCGDQLVRGECVDPRAICFVCQRNHRFFILPKPPLAGDSAKAASLYLPELDGWPQEAVASFWLTEPAARSMLNEQLAELLRSILEARRVFDEPLFSFCPICGAALGECDQPDIWVTGLRCATGHVWFVRGNRLFCALSNERIELRAEYSHTAIRQLIAGWLKGRSDLASNLHDSVRRVLMSSSP
jgi:hypothetical protein